MTDREGMMPQGPWEGKHLWLEMSSVGQREVLLMTVLGEGAFERYPLEEGY